MIEIHRNQDRGHADHGWLKTRYSFSFADWYNEKRLGFGALRVINDDIIAPHSGFGAHSHKDMEIITIVLKGAITHKDDMGNEKKVTEGMVQVMTAGTGVAHSEYNNEDIPLELFQIWIQPKIKNVTPRYEEKYINFLESRDRQQVLVGIGGLSINQDAEIKYINTSENKKIDISLEKNFGLYILVIEGLVSIENHTLLSRDAVGVYGDESVSIIPQKNTTFITIKVPLVAR